LRRKNFYLIILLLLCLAAGVYSYFQFEKPGSPANAASKISVALNTVMAAVDNEAEAIVKKKKTKVSTDTKFQFVVVKNDQIVSWNDHHFVPPVSAISDDFTVKFLKLGSGEFLAKKWRLDDGQSLVALIPLHIQYKIKNVYLSPFWNAEIFQTHPASLLEPESSDGYSVLLDTKVAFKILLSENIKNSAWGYFTAVFFFIAFGVSIFLLIKITKTGFSKYPAFSLVILIVIAFAIRKAMIYFEFPSRFIQSSLFDPKFF
jgi:hypothetical protein